MAKFLVLFTSLILGCTNASEKMKTEQETTEVTTFYLIRHAEKDRSQNSNQDPDLTKEGKARAQKWAEVLKDVKFDAVYTTDYKRTRQTAEPLAGQNGLETKIYNANKLYNEEFKKASSGKTIMIVGHSNTTPQFVNAIMGERKYENIDDSENGALFIVQVQPDGSASSQVLYIN